MMSRQFLERVAATYGRYAIGVAAVLAFALGCFGFYGSGYRDWTDIAYNALALFVLNFPGGAREGGQVSVVLDIARFVAPIVTGTAAISALLALFREQVQQRRIRRMRNHIVICGLGYVGSVFVSHLDDPKTGVVVIDTDPDSPNREVCRSLGVPVIVGDAQLQRTLEAAGVKHAAKLVAVCPNDAVNTEIVSVARQSAPNLNCLARIGDPELCALLRIQEFRENKRHTQESALDFFNTDEISARSLLDAKPIDATSGRAHILVAHLDPLGVWLIWHAARRWFENHEGDGTRLDVTVVDDNARSGIEALVGQYPDLGAVCEFSHCSTGAGDIRELLKLRADAPPLVRAYVTAYTDEQGLETALKLRHELAREVPLVVALSRAQGVSRVIGDGAKEGGGLNIEVFETLENACTMELIRGGSFEPLARAIHDRYVQKFPDAKAAKPWNELDESLKESNRTQARHIATKLRTIGCEIGPLRDWRAADFEFEHEEVETLAKMEHERWRQQVEASGTASQKDPETLLPFEELPKHHADKDRDSVKAVPHLLASVGLQAVDPQGNRRSAPVVRLDRGEQHHEETIFADLDSQAQPLQ